MVEQTLSAGRAPEEGEKHDQCNDDDHRNSDGAFAADADLRNARHMTVVMLQTYKTDAF